MSDLNKTIVSFYYVNEGLNKGNLFALDSIMDENVVDHTARPGQATGVQGLKDSIQTLRTGFPDIHFTVEFMVASDDMVVWRWNARGTHKGEFLGVPPTGKHVTATGTSIDRLSGGRIVEDWDGLDLTHFLQQVSASSQAVGATA